jgi:hypothetical protein
VLRAFVARNGPQDHFVCLRQTTPHPINSDGVLKLSSGKKKHVLVKPAGA